MKESSFLHFVAWVIIITASLTWISLFLFNLARTPVLLVFGLIILLIVIVFALTIFIEQKSNKDSDYYSKHIEK